MQSPSHPNSELPGAGFSPATIYRQSGQRNPRGMGSRAPRRSAGDLLSKVLRFWTSLLHSYHLSTLRLVALEIRAFPLRIAAVLKAESLRYGNTLSVASWDDGIGTYEEENRYARACMNRIQELRRDHRWATPLDLELASRMHRWGALWSLDNAPSGTETKSTKAVAEA